ncbi:MAG: TraB/GumN family protein [Arenimonas sp.]
MRLVLTVALLFALQSLPAWSQSIEMEKERETEVVEDTAPLNEDLEIIEAMVVSGAQPGPGMWKVSKGDNVMWIMATQSPLPKKMQWVSREVEKKIAQSDEILFPTGVSVATDRGMFGNMLLIPSLYGARKNPNDGELKDVLSPELYQRWSILKAKYIGRDKGIEKWRPIFAAQELYEKAIQKSGMSMDNIVRPVVEDAAGEYKKKIIRPKIEIKIEKPKVAIKEFSKNSLADIECFAKTLDRLETDLNAMIERGNNWAIGDIEALKRLSFTDQSQSCIAALTSGALAQKTGFGDIRQRAMAVWLAAADTALAKNKSTFAILPMSDMLNPTGLLASLRAKGYVIEEP